MNTFASTLLWMSIQVALFSLVGLVAFALVRRRGPNSAVACAATVLALTVPLALLVVSPWPRWQLVGAARPAVIDRGLNEGGDTATLTAANRPNGTREFSTVDHGTMPSRLEIWWQAAVDWMQSANAAPSTEQQRTSWQIWVPLILAVGAGLGLIRLAIGVVAVRRLRLSSLPIAEERLLGTMREIADSFSRSHALRGNALDRRSASSERVGGGQENGRDAERRRIGFPRRAWEPGDVAAVELRETAELRSAVTIGWRRPVLLLPADWRTWSDTELRVVLAHELAHVARHDYLTALVARFVTAIHFYQPLVLWLGRQLRIEQELAADSRAAVIAGNRQTYLTALAQLALRADDKPLPWAARAFLPGTSMLIKRVAWLKRKGTSMEKSLSTRARWLLTASMAAIALAVAGVRGPDESSFALAGDDGAQYLVLVANADNSGIQKERHVFANVDGTVIRLFVKHGDDVAKGQILAQMENSDLNVQIEKVQGDVRTAEKQIQTYDSTRSDRLTAAEKAKIDGERQIAMAAKETSERQLALLEKRKEALTICSPIAGKVITLKLDEMLRGRPVEKGQLLLTLAAADAPQGALAQIQPPPGGPPAGNAANVRAQAVRRSFEYVPADAKLVIAASPSEVAKAPAAAMVIGAVNEDGFEKKFGLKFAEIADLQMIEIEGKPDFDRTVVRAAKPHDWKGWITQRLGQLETIKFGKGEFVVARGETRLADFGPCYSFPDDRTLLAGTEEQMKRILGGGEKLMDAAAFPEFVNSQVAIWGDAELVKRFMEIDKLERGHVEVAALFRPLIDRTKAVRFGGSLAGGAAVQSNAQLTLALECDSADGATQVAATLDAIRTFARNFLTAQQKANAEAKAGFGDPPAALDAQIKMKLAIAEMCGFGLSTLDKAKIGSEGRVVTVAAQLDIAPAVTNAILMPAISSAREAAMRTQSVNNMRHLALAMHNFANTHGNRFPPAAIRDQNGKPGLSWRVAILPYLEQEALYKEFHLDEPWDSEHNRKLIGKMPAQFRDPHEDEKSTNASYFMVTGKGTIGGSDAGTAFKEILDGMSMTIMLVEANRDIPWTKPEDIEVDADPAKPLPKFGGHMPGHFATAFADGSVRIISEFADPKVLRKFLSISGGEPANEAGLNPPAAAPGGQPSPAGSSR